MRREADGKVYGHDSDTKLLLLLARSQLSDEVWTRMERAVANVPDLELGDIGGDDQLNRGAQGMDLRTRGGGKTNWAMHQMEVALANRLSGRGEDEWLVVDGSLQFEPPITAPRTLGIAKSFNKELHFELRADGPREKKSLFRLLMDLRPECRTAVWAARGGKIAFWYVRLRAQGKLDYPLMGVVKVEHRPPEGEALDSALVDLLSSCLVAERHVTPHGRDSRWHVHLYPIYLTEQVIKNKMVSSEVLRHSIRWPFQTA